MGHIGGVCVRSNWFDAVPVLRPIATRVEQFPWEKEPKKNQKVWTRGEILDVINRRKERAKANGKS